MLNDIEITKYPYIGYSPNLIEYFLIIGYEHTFIEREILPNFDPKMTFEPTILNSISSNTDIDMLDNDMITRLIFPKLPQIWSSSNLQQEPPSSSVIFFLNADTIGNLSKIPFHGCALIFHEYFVINSLKIFVPKAFCIVSQFPYFSLFNSINKEVLTLFESDVEVPLEILLYNMINYVPSPINFSMNVNVFPHKEIRHYASKLQSSSSNSNVSSGPSHSKASGLSSPYKKSQSSINNNSGTISVPQLNGYPVLDFNISEIFNILPVNMVVEILIFNFLEFDMLFFSKNLEILNFTMYIISILNYPCNDSIYLWHILSVSQEELISADSSQFVGKPWAAMMGVNCSYNNTIDSCRVVDSHFIVDIDSKNFFFKYTESNDDILKTNTLLNNIRKIMKDYNVQSHFLAKNIKNLVKELDIISKQVISSSNSTVTTSSYTSSYSFPFSSSYSDLLHNNTVQSQNQTNFFENGDKVKILNKNIQEAFYDFILNILIVFYNNYFLNSSFDKKKVEGQTNANFFIHYNEDIVKFSKEEVIFYNFFKSSNKYNNYILNFIQEFKCINLYKIPLIFSEEFIYLKKNCEDKIFKSRFFEIIENFYNENVGSSFTSKKPISVNFHSFFSYYETSLKIFMHEEINNNANKLSIKVHEIEERTKYLYKYDCVELNNTILFKYLHHLNNLTCEKKEEIFPSLAWKNNNQIKTTKFGEIVDTIEKNLILHKIFRSEHLIVFSLILMFIVTRSICNFNESISHLRDILELLDSKSFFLRKYINMILSIYNLTDKCNQDSTSDSADSNKYKKCLYINKMCNFIIINFLRNKNILPNEQMMRLFEFFTVQSEKDDEEFNVPENLTDEDMGTSGHDLEKFNLFLQYHFCVHGLKKADYFLKLAENVSYDGDLFLECCTNQDKRTNLVFKFDFSNKKMNTEIFSPLKLYNASYKILNDYLTHFNYYKLDRDLVDKVLINLIFYCKNSNMTYKFLLKFLDYDLI